MTIDQICLLFFGLPLAILGFGLRRAMGGKAFLLMLLGATLAAFYAVVLEAAAQAAGRGLPLPGGTLRGLARGFGPFALGGAVLGALGAMLVRYRGRGATSNTTEEDS